MSTGIIFMWKPFTGVAGNCSNRVFIPPMRYVEAPPAEQWKPRLKASLSPSSMVTIVELDN